MAQQRRTDTTRVLRTVHVQGRSLPENIKALTPVQTLGKKQLEMLPGINVADALRFFSGIQLKDYGGIGGLKTIDVRSMGTNHTAVFYDGIPLLNGQNGQVDLGKFSLDEMEQIDLYNSQRNDIFMPAAGFGSAASVYLRSKRPQLRDLEHTHVSAQFKTGSFGLIQPSVSWQQKINNRINSSVSATITEANGRYPYRYTDGFYDTTATRQNGDVHAQRFEAALYGTLRDSGEWHVKAYGYHAKQGLPGAIVEGRFSDYFDRLESRNIFLQSSFRKKITPRYQLLLNAKYSNDYMRYTDPRYPNKEGRLDNRYTQQLYYVSAANKYQLTRIWEVALSGDFIVNKMNADIDRFTYPTRYTTLIALASALHLPRLDIQGNVLGTIINEKVGAYLPAPNRRELTPALSASWQPFADHQLYVRGFYKNIFRMPTFNDLYYTRVGTRDLRPEFVKQYDLGLTWYKSFRNSFVEYLSAQTDAYFNDVTDKIIAQPSGNLDQWKMTNLDRVHVHGLEAAIQTLLRVSHSVSINSAVNYTFQQARLAKKEELNYHHQVPYIPRHSGTVLAGAAWKQLHLQYSFVYTGERYSQSTNIPINYVQPWYTHDVAASWQFRYRAADCRLAVEVNNLLNQYYDVVLNFPMPGRNYRFTLKISY